MTINLRVLSESQLGISLEGVWGLPVSLMAPDGTIINTSQNDGLPLVGQILYDTIKINPETGDQIIVNNPVVTLRRSSLSRVPKGGERWLVSIPVRPDPLAEKAQFVTESPPQGGASLGYIKLYLRKVQQS